MYAVSVSRRPRYRRRRRQTCLDISDTELCVILSQVRHAKGDRITVILDCSFMKDVSNVSILSDARKSRSLPPSTTPMDEILQAWNGSVKFYYDHPSIPIAQDWDPDFTSYVTLQVCNNDQLAWEVLWADGTIGGVFHATLA